MAGVGSRDKQRDLERKSRIQLQGAGSPPEERKSQHLEKIGMCRECRGGGSEGVTGVVTGVGGVAPWRESGQAAGVGTGSGSRE